jgi:Site-specific recombinase XerD
MRQKLVQKHAERIKFFEESIKSKYTRKAYLLHFKKYMEHLGSKFNSLLEEEDPKKIEQSIIDYIILLKKTKSFAAIHNYVAAIIAFYKINDIILNIDKIARFMPDKRKANKDRGYEHEEILRLLGVSDERMRVVILLLASTGMRIGAIPGLRLRNLEKIEVEVGIKIYKIIVYENDNEEHFTFCTPECAKAIDEYLEMRKRYGEKLYQDCYLVREQFDIRDPFAISKCQKTIANTLVNKIILLAERSGIRTRQTLEENQKHRAGSFRKDVAVCHGFRKFFTKQLINSRVNPEIREMLMGHKIGLASVYYKPTDDDFLIEFQKAINNLTINEENRLKMQVKKLEIEKSQLQQLAADVAILKKKYRGLK